MSCYQTHTTSKRCGTPVRTDVRLRLTTCKRATSVGFPVNRNYPEVLKGRQPSSLRMPIAAGAGWIFSPG